MGIFDFLRKMNEGTYGLVARNITYNYFVLNKRYKNEFKNIHELLFMCGFLNASKYFALRQMKGADISNSIILAVDGYCGSDPYLIKHSAVLEPNQEKEILLNFIMQMEVLYFIIDSKVPLNHIVDIVISKKRVIEKNIDERLLDFKYSRNINLQLESEIDIFMSNY
nr:hypothetical protein [Chitinophagales bacterium]